MINSLDDSNSSADSDELRRFGYAQTLRRSMGGFSSFALAFSLISISTGIFANFQTGVQQAGPAAVWSWLMVLAGQVLVALVLAELATQFPISGYGYQWASRLVNPHYGFFVGWLLLLQFLTGFPGVCATLSDYARIIWNPPVSASMLTVIVIAAITVIHLLGIRLASLVNDAGVIAEIAGAIIIGSIFLVAIGPSSEHGLRILMNTTNFVTNAPAGVSGFALSLLMGAWCLTGFEASADLAEETHRPRRVIPRAMLTSLLSSGLGGFLILVGFMLAISDVRAVQSAPQPLLYIIEAKLGAKVTPLVVGVVLISIFACAVASMAATSRLIFSLARDNMLPCSRLLSTIQPTRRTPSATIILIGVLASVVVLWFEKLALITSISAVAGYLGYAGIVLAAIVTTRESEMTPDAFAMHRWGRYVRVAALAWTILLVAALTVPDTGDGHMPAKTTAMAIAFGIALYIALIRKRILSGKAGPSITRASDQDNRP